MTMERKRISPNLKSQISIIKGYIVNAIANQRGFDGDNSYVFNVAIKELRLSGYKIIYNKEKRHYKGI